MRIEFTPMISGGFIDYLLNNPNLQEHIKNLEYCGFKKPDIHKLFRDITIASFSKFEVDVNEEINKAKRFAALEAKKNLGKG
jgi:predicted nucleotide-binding protein (sugar kinase/HSP70/actin superfamily)